MENYKQLLTAQQEALQKDIEAHDEEIKFHKEMMDDLIKKKKEVVKVLRGIEKKLAKKEF